jgi:hypothetical protein
MLSCCGILRRIWCALCLVLAFGPALADERAIPKCRLDDAHKEAVQAVLTLSAAAFKAMGKALPFEGVVVNGAAVPGKPTLTAFIVQDASASGVTAQGCAQGEPRPDDTLDAISVRGGCVLVAVDRMEVRCSSRAVRLFSDMGGKSGRANNPALLYVLSHELGHLYQRRVGQYTGRAEKIDLTRDRAAKLQELQDSCDPSSTKKEDEADALAVAVLTRELKKASYVESTFSERGSLYWNIDLLNLASDAWMKASLEREFISQPAVHKSFVPTEFPTSRKTIDANARRFVCDVLTRTKGSILYPSRSLTHPPVEQRLRRIAEALQPVAKDLPDNSSQLQYAPIARLQTDLGPIFTQIYRETGVYMEAVQASICTMVNAPEPPRCK